MLAIIHLLLHRNLFKTCSKSSCKLNRSISLALSWISIPRTHFILISSHQPSALTFVNFTCCSGHQGLNTAPLCLNWFTSFHLHIDIAAFPNNFSCQHLCYSNSSFHCCLPAVSLACFPASPAFKTFVHTCLFLLHRLAINHAHLLCSRFCFHLPSCCFLLAT